MANCKSCGAEVVWAISESTGKSQIIDAKPVEPGVTLDRHGKPIPEGNIALEERQAKDNFGNPAPTAVFVGADTLFGPEERHVDHHVTCPYADQYKGPRKR